MECFIMPKSQKSLRLSVEEYLIFEESARVKHEFVDGQLFAMTGGTQAHSLISSNIVSCLNSKLKGSGCRVHGSDLKVRIDASKSIYYPDASVDCGAYDKSSVYTRTPAIIFEVLSPSTAATDRREKLVAYRQIPSLKAYVIVQQARRRIEIHRKVEQDNWVIEEIGPEDEIVLEPCPGRAITLSLEDVYADTDLSDGPELQVKEDAEVYAW
jgi:Uma2 family endonuclease